MALKSTQQMNSVLRQEVEATGKIAICRLSERFASNGSALHELNEWNLSWHTIQCLTIDYNANSKTQTQINSKLNAINRIIRNSLCG